MEILSVAWRSWRRPVEQATETDCECASDDRRKWDEQPRGKKHDDVDQRARDCIARGWAEVVIGCCADPRLSYACTVQLLKAMRKSKMWPPWHTKLRVRSAPKLVQLIMSWLSTLCAKFHHSQIWVIFSVSSSPRRSGGNWKAGGGN